MSSFLHQKEPVSSKSPTFQTDSKVSMFVRRTGEDFALLCQAQAFPVPLIRYVTIHSSLNTFVLLLSFFNISYLSPMLFQSLILMDGTFFGILRWNSQFELVLDYWSQNLAHYHYLQYRLTSLENLFL